MFRRLPAHEFIIDQRPEQLELDNYRPDFRAYMGQAAQVMDSLGFVVLRQTFDVEFLRDMSLRGHNSSDSSGAFHTRSWSQPFSALAHDLERWRRRPTDVDYTGSQVVSGRAIHTNKDEKIVVVPDYEEPQTHIVAVADGTRRVRIGRGYKRTITTELEANDTLIIGRPVHGTPSVSEVTLKDTTPNDKSWGGRSLMLAYSYLSMQQSPTPSSPWPPSAPSA